MEDITAHYRHPMQRHMDRLRHLPPPKNYDDVRRAYAILHKKMGFGSRMKFPRHVKTVQLLLHEFPHDASVIDLGTDGNGQLVRLLSRGGKLSDGTEVPSRPIVHATDWLLQIHQPAMKDLIRSAQLPMRDDRGNLVNASGEPIKNSMDKEIAYLPIDTRILPFSYQELDQLPDDSYDVVLSLHVLDALLSWADADEAIDHMKRICRLGIIATTSAGSDKSRLARQAKIDKLQRIGIVRLEWDEFFERHNFMKVVPPKGHGIDDEHYLYKTNTVPERKPKKQREVRRDRREGPRVVRGRGLRLKHFGDMDEDVRELSIREGELPQRQEPAREPEDAPRPIGSDDLFGGE